MKVGSKSRFVMTASTLLLAISASMPVRADEALVDSPRYAAWAKFKPESSATLSADIQMGPNAVHVEMIRKLKSLTADELKIETSTQATFMGKTSEPRMTEQTLHAKEARQEMKDLGDKDVAAMGKSYKCKAYELTGGAASALSPTAGRARATTQPRADAKATVYVCDDVPGGMVKLEITGPGGNPMTFLLTAVDVK